MKSMVPKIRFYKYKNNWSIENITKLGKIFIGLVTTMTEHYTDSGTLLIRNSDIKENRFIFDEKKIYLDNVFAKTNSGRMHKIGDIVTVHTGDVGTSSVISKNEENSIGFATIVTRPNVNVIDSYYLSTYLNTSKHKSWAVNISTGDGRMNYNLNDYIKLDVPLPGIDEQKSIAKFFICLNNVICDTECKLDKLNEIKKTMLYKMFPQNGKKVPEIRLKGFEGEWNEKSIFEVANRYDNLRIPIEESKRKKGTVQYYGANGIQDYIEGFTHNGEFILVAEDGANDIKEYPVLYVCGKIWVNNHAHVLQVKSNLFDNRFLAYSLKNVNYGNVIVGSSRFKLNSKELMSINIMIPNINEQQAIAEYFNRYDNMIKEYKQKITKLKELKKTLLNKMFV